MLSARASLPNLFPIFPKPIIPRYFPRSSVPLSSFLSQFPFLISRSPLAVCLAKDNINPKTNSATAFIAPSTALITRMFFVFAASSSILSSPTPTRAIILQLSAFSISSLVSFVLLLTITILYCPIVSWICSAVIVGS